MKTSALPPGRRLNGRNPAHAHTPASANARCASSGCTVTASIAKNPNAIAASVAARPSMLSSRLNAFVMPTSQRIASGHATNMRVDQLDAGARCEHDHRRGDLQRELQLRRERTHVVDQPRDEEERDPGVDPRDLLGRRDRAGRDRGPDPDGQPGEDRRRRRRAGSGTSCQRSLVGTATSRRCSPVARRSLIASAEAGRAAIAARVLTSSEGRSVAVRAPWRVCVPTLVCRHDGLRRPAFATASCSRTSFAVTSRRSTRARCSASSGRF